MVNLMTPYLYAKGTCNVVVRNISTGDVDYQSNKVQTAQMQTTVDMGAIQAGIGNATAIQIPHNAALNLTLTNADFSMSGRAMSVGSQLAYGGIAPTCEVVTAASTQLQITNLPAAAPYGYLKNICNVVEAGVTNAPGTAYEIDDNGNVVGFTAEVGKSYTVTYFKQNPSAEYFNVGGAFSPAIKHVTVQIAVYSTDGTQNATQGTKVGDLYIIIPRMQFSGKADIDGSQTANAPTDLSGTALTFDEASNVGVCSDCAIPGLAQIMYVPAANASASVQGMAVVGGGFTIASGNSAVLPIKWVMPDGSLQQPVYNEMTYSIPTEGQTYATVDTNGLVTALSAGSTTITATLTANPQITYTGALTVTA